MTTRETISQKVDRRGGKVALHIDDGERLEYTPEQAMDLAGRLIDAASRILRERRGK